MSVISIDHAQASTLLDLSDCAYGATGSQNACFQLQAWVTEYAALPPDAPARCRELANDLIVTDDYTRPLTNHEVLSFAQDELRYHAAHYTRPAI